MILAYRQSLLAKARYLRNNSTVSEVILWNQLKSKKLGFTFLRQKPIDNFIVDFYCQKLKLVIEIDGSSHQLKFEADNKRDKLLRSLGIHVIRIKHLDVLENIQGVVDQIKQVIKSLCRV